MSAVNVVNDVVKDKMGYEISLGMTSREMPPINGIRIAMIMSVTCLFISLFFAVVLYVKQITTLSNVYTMI
jgi:hypothetical protein